MKYRNRTSLYTVGQKQNTTWTYRISGGKEVCMKKKWLKGMAMLLSTALLITLPGMPVKADNVTEDGLVKVTEAAEQIVRSVSGGDAEILYTAPGMEWVDIWSLRMKQPEGFVADDAHQYGFEVEMSRDGLDIGYWTSEAYSEVEFSVYYDLTVSGTYTYVGYFTEDGSRISETVTLEREYTAPADKIGTTTATWHDGSIPVISFPEVPHAGCYLISRVKDGIGQGGTYWRASSFERHEDGTLWTNEYQSRDILKAGSGEYQVTVQAISENVLLYANGDAGPLSESFVFDGVFGKISTGDIAQVKEGLANEKVTEIEYNLPEGTQVSESDQAEIFSALKGKDKSLTLSFRNEDYTTGYQWTFDGTEIVDDTKTMNFQIIVDANVQEVIDCVDTSKLNEVDLAFLHEGELPGRATVTVNLGGRLGGAETAHLYYYNPETRQLEIVAENLAVVNGQVAFPMSHCSNYILTAEMLKDLIPDREPEKPETKPDPKPDTGSNQPVAVQAQINPQPVFTSVVSYVVEPGDTLKKIAAKFFGSRDYWTKIYEDNAGSIADPNRIYPGQVLFICLTENPAEEKDVAAGEIYMVQPGDSLWKIAKKVYGKGLLYARIYEANREVIGNPRSLRVGQKIVLPR